MLSTILGQRSGTASRQRVGRVLAFMSEVEQRSFLPEPLLGELRALAQDVVFVQPDHGGSRELVAALERERPEVLLACWKTPLLPEVLPPELRYVCYLCGSVKRLVTRRHLEQGLLVTNWGGSVSRIVAEWALFHMLSSLRRATYWAIAMHTQGGWKNEQTETASLFGRSVGIHGFGQVARELTRLLRPFGVTVHVFAPDVDSAVEHAFEVHRAPSLEALFAESDILVELAPLIPETVGVVTEKHLRLLRPGAIFVNIGRGAVVDEAALVRVAREGRVQFGLDVFTHEPLAPDHPLRGMSNVTLTPHLAGPTTDRRRDATAFALANLRAYAEGRKPEAVVTPEIYDQSS